MLRINQNWRCKKKGLKNEHLEIEWLARAISPHDDFKNIIARCIAITVHVKSPQFSEAVKKIIFLKINQAICGHVSAQGVDRSSLVICADVEGSRRWRAKFHNPEVPHLHGILILSPPAFEVWQYAMPQLMAACQQKIMEIKQVGQAFSELGRRARKCHVLLRPLTGTAESWLTYGNKAFDQATLMGEDFDPPSVFPYDIVMQKGGRLADELEERMKAARAELLKGVE